ncbi:MAG: TonB family protein [Ignavibacteriaceae bacterium]|nr:TonB family protein [Ignavibacteriaceae bacterium]
MKKMILLSVVLFLGLFMSCKNDTRNSDIRKPGEPKIKTENFLNYDYQLDVKSIAKVNHVKFLKEINSIFPVDTILKHFGRGVHNFYLALSIYKNGKPSRYMFVQDVGFMYGSVPENFREQYELSHSADKKKSVNSVFYNSFVDKNKIFETKLGQLTGKNVSSIKYFEIRLGIDKNKKVITSCSIKEIDLKKYLPVFDGKYNRNDFLSGGFTTIIGGLEALNGKITYPSEAKSNSVTGKVVVNAYIDEKGNVVGTQLFKGIGWGCDEAALKAVSEVKFHPSPSGKCQAIIPIDFELEYKPESYDLTNTQITFSPNPPKTGEKNKVFFNVVNVGQKAIPSKAFTNSLYIDNELVMASISKMKMNPNKSEGYFVSWTPKRIGKLNYIIYLDSKNELNESNRTNNVIKGQVEVKEGLWFNRNL